MADREKQLFQKYDGVAFEDDPEEYCKSVFADAQKRNDNLAKINEENRLFYEGRDLELEARKNDPDVVRSGLFIHEVKPAIDTRRAGVLTRLEEREFPITVRPNLPMPTEDESKKALWIERIINQQLRECGYLSEGFSDHILAAEIYRSPATVKVGWENVYTKDAEVVKPSEEEILTAAVEGNPPPKDRVRFISKYQGGRPYVELLSPEEFLYEPSVAYFQRDSEYACHAIWMSWTKLFAVAMESGWDEKVLKRYKGEIDDADAESSVNDTIEESIQQERDTPFINGYKDGKVLVAEFYILTYDDAGDEVIYQVVMIGNKYIVANRRSPYKGVKFPFVAAIANRLPGTIEGLSSIDVSKMMQRLYNELFNSFLDGISYRTFPPLVRQPGTELQKKPKWGLGQIWDVTNPEGLRPLIENPGPLPDLPSLITAVSAKIRDLLNAHDISQGFQANQYEKATSTKLRATGSAQRAMPVHKRYGEALIEVAKMVLALNQQYHELATDFVLDVVIDVPSLTNVSDPESEKQESLLLLAQASQSPLYQSPLGKKKLRNLYQTVYEKFKVLDIDKYLHTEDELTQENQILAEMETSAMAKQEIQEGMAIQGQQVQGEQ